MPSGLAGVQVGMVLRLETEHKLYYWMIFGFQWASFTSSHTRTEGAGSPEGLQPSPPSQDDRVSPTNKGPGKGRVQGEGGWKPVLEHPVRSWKAAL